MKVQTLTIPEARDLLRRNQQLDLNMDIRIAESHRAPGGGELIAYHSHLTPRTLEFIAHRKRHTGASVNLIVYDDGPQSERPAPPIDEIEEMLAQKGGAQRAKEAADKVVADAKEVAEQARKIYETITSPLFRWEHLDQPDTKQALSTFDEAMVQFCCSTESAIHDYVDNGNTLIMDIISEHKLDIASLRHALKVACFATELASMAGIEDFLADSSGEDVFGQLGESMPSSVADELLEEKRCQLLKKELVEIFIGGFMHDAGLWGTSIVDGHEVRGAMVVSKTPAVEAMSRSLIDIVLFHTNVQELAANGGVARILNLPDGEGRPGLQRDFFASMDEANAALKARSGKFYHKILSAADLRKVVPVAIAEQFISRTQSRTPVSTKDAVSDLVSFSNGGIYQKLMVVLCNTQPEVVAPPRVLVSLDGKISVRPNGHPRWLDVTDFVAVSAGHNGDRLSPHLFTVFARDEDGSMNRLSVISPEAPQLWERSDPSSRMYISAGKFPSLSYKVTDILRNDIYDKHFRPFEEELSRRLSADVLY